MKLKKQIATNMDGLKEQGADNLAAFVKRALQANGRDYETICQRMMAVEEFVANTKEYGINADLSKIEEVYQDFFVGNRKINEAPSLSDKHIATYEKHGEFGDVINCMVSMQRSSGEIGSVLWFNEIGHEKEFFTSVHFAEDNLFFQTLVLADAQERLKLDTQMNNNSYLNFSFDKMNHLTQVAYRLNFDTNRMNYTDCQLIDLAHTQTQERWYFFAIWFI